MSVFTNRADEAADEAERYVGAVLARLGERPATDVLEETPAELRRLVAGHAPHALRRPEGPGKWSALEVVRHLGDSDLAWAYRMRLVVAEDRPPLVAFDQDLWAQGLRYQEGDMEEALAEFEALRSLNLRFIQRLDAAALQRVGMHSARGEERLDVMIRLYAGHDLVHLAQLTRILAST